MKILLMTDIHGTYPEFLAIVKHAEDKGLDFNCVFQLGDFGIWPGEKGELFTDNISSWAVENNKSVLFIGGNHEDYSQINGWKINYDKPWHEIKSKLYYVWRGSRWQWDKLKFGALGGAFSVDYRYRHAGDSWWPDEEEVHTEDIVNLGPKPLDVLLGHTTGYRASPTKWPEFQDQPAALRLSSETELRSRVSEYIYQIAIDTTQPKWYFHGHWHLVNTFEDKHDNGNITNVLGFACLDSRYGTMGGVIEDCYAILDTENFSITFRDNIFKEGNDTD